MSNIVSPYLQHAARRISAQIIPIRPLATVHATTAEFPHRYSRCISDGLPLEKSPPIESWGKAFVGGALIFGVFIPAILFLMGVFK